MEEKKKLEEITLEDLEQNDVVQVPSYFDFRVGWNLPDNVADIPELLRLIGRVAHWDWQRAMERGDVPCEDVSPGEGFEHLAIKLEEHYK